MEFFYNKVRDLIRSPKGGVSIYSDAKGFLWIKYDEFHESFCEDLDAGHASLASHPEEVTALILEAAQAV